MAQEEITIALVQPDIVWNDIRVNLSNFNRILDSCHPGADMILFPEMFTTRSWILMLLALIASAVSLTFKTNLRKAV